MNIFLLSFVAERHSEYCYFLKTFSYPQDVRTKRRKMVIP